MKISKTLNLYLEHCKLDRNLSDRTIEFYQIDLQQFINYVNEKNIQYPRKIDRKIIRSYYRSLRGYSIRSIRRKLTVIKGYLHFLEFEEIIKANPFRTLGFRTWEPRKVPQVMDLEEVKRILTFQAAEKENIKNKDVKIYGEKLRDLLILEFLFATGVRVSELCGIKFEDVNLAKASMLVRGKGKKERIVHLSNPETIVLFHEYYFFHKKLIQATGFFFINRLGKKLAYSSVRHLVLKVVANAGVKKKVTPHTFRHTFATLFLEQDVDLKYIQHFLGHSSIRTTQIYTHVTNKKHLQILEDKHPRNLFRLKKGSLYRDKNKSKLSGSLPPTTPIKKQCRR